MIIMNQLKAVYPFLRENKSGFKWNKNKRRCVILYETFKFTSFFTRTQVNRGEERVQIVVIISIQL